MNDLITTTRLNKKIILEELLLIKVDHSIQISEDDLDKKVNLLLEDLQHLSPENFRYKSRLLRKSELYGKFPKSVDYLEAENLPEPYKKPAVPSLEDLSRQENIARAKFFRGNIEIFLRYFDSREQYDALIAAGNFKKMDEIIAEGKRKI